MNKLFIFLIVAYLVLGIFDSGFFNGAIYLFVLWVAYWILNEVFENMKEDWKNEVIREASEKFRSGEWKL